MTEAVLALNAGSSSIKFGVFDVDRSGLRSALRGTIDKGDDPHLEVRPQDGSPVTIPLPDARSTTGIAALLETAERNFGGRRIVVCGHRIVHGGAKFFDPVMMTPETIQDVAALSGLAPLHQERSLEPIEAVDTLRPRLAQVGCFDTAFHRTIEGPASRFAIPRLYEEKGIRRYGFHGLSYEYVSGRLGDEGKSNLRTVVAHLGNGASLCALRGGRSVDTTMGFSALDGLVMGTRSGTVDPGVLLHLLQSGDKTPDELQTMLYRESGLLGVSGISGDMRVLEASADSRAKEAIELFVFRVAREIAALAGTLGGLECLVFTAGIGAHSDRVRSEICARLGWLGAEIDGDANARHASLISSSGSSIEVRVLPTDEEVVIAAHSHRVASEAGILPRT
jgi:acetate kinase